MELKMKQEQTQLIPQQAWKEDEEETQKGALRQALEQTNDKAQEKALQQIQQQAPQLFSQAQATKVANGTPSQQVKSAKETYKARRAARKEERRHAREAKKATGGVGNIVTYDIKHKLEDYNKQLTNSLESYFPLIESGQSGKQEMDLSKNLSGMDPQVLRNYSHGFRKDSAGNPATPDDLKYQLEDAAFYDAFCSEDYTRRVPYLQRMVEEALSFEPKEDMFSDSSLQRNAAGLKSMTSRMVYMKNIRKDEHNKFFFDGLLSPAKREALDQALDIFMYSGPAFTVECQKRGVEPDSDETPYLSKEEIAAYSKAQENGEGFLKRYQEGLETYSAVKDTLKQAGAELPAPEVYQQIRSLLKDDVQKLLDCDVEKLRNLSDEDLLQRRAELNELYAASLNVEKCLTLKRPDQFNPRSELTLREDLIGQRKLEYEYKSALLRGLAERAAGFKEQGKQTMEAASTLYQKRMTPGTEECQKFFEYFGKEHNLQGLIINTPRFDDVAKEFYAGTGELAEAAERLKEKQYFSLDEEKRIRLDMPKTIGEPLFRSLGSFLHLEATNTLLTPEQFKQMLLNLGAGAKLTPHSAKEERDKAIEKNNAGLDTLREVMAAQYEMLERKYGNCIEQLTVKDVMEHFTDIAKDFGNIQVDLHMTKCFPGFIRENNPDDEHLDNLIRYYNTCAFHVFDIVAYIGNGYITAEEVSDERFKVKFGEIFKDLEDPQKRDTIEELEKLKERVKRDKIEQPRTLKEMDMFMKLRELNRFRDLEKLWNARETLMGDNSFQHPLDWTQKVKKPADTE